MAISDIENTIVDKAKKIYYLPIPKTIGGLKKRAKQYSLKTTKKIKGVRYPKTQTELTRMLTKIKSEKSEKFIKSLIFNIAIKYLLKIQNLAYKQKLAIASQIANRHYKSF